MEKQNINEFIYIVNDGQVSIYKLYLDRDELIDIVANITKRHGKRKKCVRKLVRSDATHINGVRILDAEGFIKKYKSMEMKPIILDTTNDGITTGVLCVSREEFLMHKHPDLSIALIEFINHPSSFQRLSIEMIEILNAPIKNLRSGMEFIPSILSCITKEKICSFSEEKFEPTVEELFLCENKLPRENVKDFSKNLVTGTSMLDRIQLYQFKKDKRKKKSHTYKVVGI
ncbi:MAG TPA: hypothetical protein PLC53_01010 [Bacilli bacterium]|nr:hypothetical protein [Bacilli bacterium]